MNYPSILNYSANFNILKQISSELIQGTSLTLITFKQDCILKLNSL